MRRSVRTLRPPLKSVQEGATGDSYREYLLTSTGCKVLTRYFDAVGSAAAIMVGGVGGDFDSPANELYPRLARSLQPEGVSTLRVQFRDPVDLDDSMADVLLGIEFLRSRGTRRIALVGHSLGGAVAIQAALRSPDVVTVVTLATQGFGTEGVEDLAPRSILLVHGYDDDVLPPVCSIDAYDRAAQPKTLKLLEGTRHGLNESATDVFTLLQTWLLRELRADKPSSPQRT
jgi:dienelactone hydrolase